ncbi:LUD domain-containing protein [Streptomyces sp. NPDC046977]|uniref:LUD domain-containing protein n=1 Tax=Streptomyces sp. NPDC046977 TaxID=3154703 RepID=UPI0033E1B830
MTENDISPDVTFGSPASGAQLEQAAKALRENGFGVEIVDTLPEARRVVNQLLPMDRDIFTATSETLRLTGLAEDIDNSGRYRSIRAQQLEWDFSSEGDTMRRTRSAPDVVVGSVHAVTEDGQLVTASASGSQLAPYAAGAAQAIWVVGAQKVVADLDTALRRIRTYSYPNEDVRAQQAYGQPSVIAKILVISREVFPGRATVVLVREPVGF